METELRIDPLKTIGLKDVINRTGFKRSTIYKLLAEDSKNKTPGHAFAAPLKQGSGKLLKWREITVVRWMEMQEAKV